MNYIDNDILIVSKEDFSQKTLKKLTTQKLLKITGDYKLTYSKSSISSTSIL